MFAQQLVETPIGAIKLTASDSGLLEVSFEGKRLGKNKKLDLKANKHTRAAAKQLLEYFQGKRKRFDLTLQVHGTPFQQKVWRKLLAIPFGEVRSYKDVAQSIGQNKAYRAVGGANNRNPFMIIVPCHRVLAHNKGLGGYACGVEVKDWLLQFEREMGLK